MLDRNGFNIRLLQEEDQKSVQAFMKPHPLQFPERIINIYPERWAGFLFNRDESDNGYYVALHHEQVVGHAGYTYNRVEQMYEIVGVIVKADLQGSGIGTGLIGSICNRAMSLGGSKIMLYTQDHPGNELTLRFYRKMGFVEADHDADFWGVG